MYSSNSPSWPDHQSYYQRNVFQKDPIPPSPQPEQINCDRSHRFYDLCTINGPAVLDPVSSTLYLSDPTISSATVEKIRPYPRKWEKPVMAGIQEFTLISNSKSPVCQTRHKLPAIVFSAVGYTGNFFHDFNDGFIPLFITVNSVFPSNQDFILVISQARNWWISKYGDLLHTYSKHPVIIPENETSTHCFPSATLGLISHGSMTINPKLMPNSQAFTHFRAFLDKAYNHGQNHPWKFNSPKPRPRLVLATRNGGVGRVISNQNQVKHLAEEIGFDVIVFEPAPQTPLQQAYALINSSHAMVGVHGAGLTHSLFLRPGVVFMQVVPIGAGWLAEVCFANSARAMGLEYLEYRIGVEESSLTDKYGKNSLLIEDPATFRGEKWSSTVMDIYLKEQNVKLDLIRFREYLKEAYKKAEKFMEKEG
ncbi:protein O-linked-mannose beta-1,4-N-acetylglucosaminyltransferase [Salix suchowensis]|nr:protein O-linked-mannose beta-1,4-N-acetylglucosaminyltransferase [Salix suchowensis]